MPRALGRRRLSPAEVGAHRPWRIGELRRRPQIGAAMLSTTRVDDTMPVSRRAAPPRRALNFACDAR